ncbi:hypothetical protein D1013_17660 [Euzebyella marina]|uniref:Uncharacterized protein n=1 Tax=Euzebyella marina TaxID=1761453 RepID=A0A3G2LA07_9FLAO|nr:hypothetical protein [Euzebyella marina]AYN69074.1 hypothetical protein D1013_17660 [Euzebyella marina]
MEIIRETKSEESLDINQFIDMSGITFENFNFKDDFKSIKNVFDNALSSFSEPLTIDFDKFKEESQFKDLYLTESKLKLRGFVENEEWTTKISIQSRVVEIDNSQIKCDCLVDQTERVFELRIFDKSLFDHIETLSVGSPILLKIYSKPGSSRIDVLDGEKIVDDSLFDLGDVYSNIEGKGLDKPFFKP